MTQDAREGCDHRNVVHDSVGRDISDQIPPALTRVYDYVLDGATNFAIDRALAEKVLALIPGYRDFAYANRTFLRRAVQYMAAAGIEQFLDLGSGMLSLAPVGEVARKVNPRSRVVYVDNDPIVTSHVRAGVLNNPQVDVLEADLCDVDEILDHEVTRHVLDLDRPVGVCAVAVLHCLTDQDHPAAILRRYHDRLAAGSLLAASHASGETLDAAVTAAGITSFAQAGITVVSRTHSEFLDLLGPWQPQADGVVPIHLWRPDDHPVDEDVTEGKDSLGYAVMATSSRRPTRDAS